MEPRPFHDRTEAGRLLAGKLAAYADRADVIVLSLPRGGVPVAYEVARALNAPLDVFLCASWEFQVTRSSPWAPSPREGSACSTMQTVRALRIPDHVIEAVAAREQQELDGARAFTVAIDHLPTYVAETVILVDDGLATGATMLAAVKALRQQQVGRIVVAVPIASPETCEQLRGEVDEIICAVTPEPFYAVGCWYEDFSQATDEEVRDLLARSARAGEEAKTPE